MTVRKLRSKQRGPWCSYCDNRAVHTSGHRKWACTEHLTQLHEYNDHQETQDSYETEGEYQALRGY